VDISSERLLPNYGISMDWLLCGDLKALQRMMQAPGQGSRDAREREKFVRLSESEREIIRKKVDEFLEDYQWSAGADRTGSATGKDLLHTRRGYGECSRFIADPLLWKCG
jgi:hypothetical protein